MIFPRPCLKTSFYIDFFPFSQVVLANLWAIWCPPCEEEMPIFQSFYEKHRQDGFVVIAIEQGDPSEEVRSFVQAHRLTFPVWLDPTQQAITQAFQTARLPSSYVLDRYSRVRLMWYGAINEDTLEKYVPPIIMEKH